MTAEEYARIRVGVALGWAADIEWSENVKAPTNAQHFALEIVYIICNSGMRWKVARAIYDRVAVELLAGRAPDSVFGHKRKCISIGRVWLEREKLFRQYSALMSDDSRVEFLGELPHIGPITKWHAAKNFGLDVAKPDRHLERVAAWTGETVTALCTRLAAASGDRVATVDYVIWRAAESGMIVTRPGIAKSMKTVRAGVGHGDVQ